MFEDRVRWRVPVTLLVSESYVRDTMSLFDEDTEVAPRDVAECMEERLADQMSQCEVEVDVDAPEREVLTSVPSS